MMAREMNEMRIFICNTHARQFQTFRFVKIVLFRCSALPLPHRSLIHSLVLLVRRNAFMLHIFAAN